MGLIVVPVGARVHAAVVPAHVPLPSILNPEAGAADPAGELVDPPRLRWNLLSFTTRVNEKTKEALHGTDPLAEGPGGSRGTTGVRRAVHGVLTSSWGPSVGAWSLPWSSSWVRKFEVSNAGLKNDFLLLNNGRVRCVLYYKP